VYKLNRVGASMELCERPFHSPGASVTAHVHFEAPISKQ